MFARLRLMIVVKNLHQRFTVSGTTANRANPVFNFSAIAIAIESGCYLDRLLFGGRDFFGKGYGGAQCSR